MAERKKNSKAQDAVKSNKGILSIFKDRFTHPENEQLKMNMDPGPGLPMKTMCGLGCLLLFLILLIVMIRPDGAIILAIRSLIYGFLGIAGFYALLPVSLAYGIILLAVNDKPIALRSIAAPSMKE